MKLTAGLITAFAGYVAAAQQSAEVFIVPTGDASSPPAITPSLARLLLLQRLAPSGRGLSLHDIPNGVGTEHAVSLINRFGKDIPPLFSDGQATEPSQLVLMLESMDDKQMKGLRKALGMSPSFTIADPPSGKAHRDLMELDFYRAGVADGSKCSIQQVVNPLESCWAGKRSAAAKFSIKENPELLDEVPKQIKQLLRLAKTGELQTTIVALPSTKSSSNWLDEQQQELRRRQAEQVISSFDRPAVNAEPTASPKPDPIFDPSERIKACYESKEACMASTRNCSSHGECQDKYAKADGSKNTVACFSCHCQSTRSKSGSLTTWAGPTCAKKDVSVAFWLFAGFTLALVGILYLAISILFNVGEEQLPGVIGAGVSRSK
ncbi:hypothetical protein J3458_002222 [Metarhizium acridum]|uniref:Vacuolar sorting protein Vps3844 C-terminal domain-containing protein n=1 Tax=Metarhizium acridum (strain CQMa 102) TaxID=655827 RepID=E9E5L3_METAQ|nr:uncharacterized protein MAC_05161 [Metarhizium acridum CQMa 102]EFY88726.1 hypothetical protein MAC_05161 [Metarhizium acridum CQMa 102]KAG8425533.1 hypothetical protein J3458_002222 [Metarhizium acridum]